MIRIRCTSMLAGLALAALLTAGCGGSGSGTASGKARHAGYRGPKPPSAKVLGMSVTDTVQALRDPKRGIDGAWAMLHRLGITVRDRHGKVVLPGSGTGTKDFFVYDFEVPGLARMARGKARRPPGKIRGVWPKPSAAFDFAEALTGSTHAVTWTPLEEWLHLVDGHVPPPRGGSARAGWGPNVVKAGGTAAPDPSTDPVVIAHLMLVAQSIDIQTTPLVSVLDEGVGAGGDTVKFTTRVNVKPVGSITAGPLAIIQVKAGPIEGVHVNWGASTLQHGAQLDPPAALTTTDALGATNLSLQAGTDPGKPTDPQVSASGTVTADVTSLEVLSKAFVLPGALLPIAATFPHVPGFAAYALKWHEPRRGPVDHFADGEWQGTATEDGGISKSNIEAHASGAPISFHFTVKHGKVTGGAITFSVPVTGTAVGHSISGSVDGTGDLSGTASDIIVTSTATIHANVAGIGGSSITTSGSSSFQPGEGTCDEVTGDMAIEGRKIQSSAGFNTNVTAHYVARRVSGPPC